MDRWRRWRGGGTILDRSRSLREKRVKDEGEKREREERKREREDLEARWKTQGFGL